MFNKLAKLVCIGDIKQVDNNNVLDMLIIRLDDSTIFCDAYIPPEVNDQRGNFGELRDYIYWIQMFGDEVSKNINKLVLDIKSWKEIYYAICHINLELRQIEPQHQSGDSPANGHLNGVNHIRHVVIAHCQYPKYQKKNSRRIEGFYRILLVQAKTKYKKLIVDKSEAVKNIMKLNTEIKWAHEIIASEISNFLKFRTEFYGSVLKDISMKKSRI